MKVLLVRVKPHRKSVNLQSFMVCEPLELEYAYAALEQNGHEVDIADMICEKVSFKKILKRKQYDFVCFTGYIVHVGIIKEHAAAVKRLLPNAKTVVGGVHAEVVPEDFVCSRIDYILWANAISTLVSVVGGSNPEEESGVYKRGAVKPSTVHVEDEILPDRQCTKKYRDKYNYIYHDKCATIKTSFGCPFDCSFCFCTRVCGYAVRKLERVMDELESIEEKNVFIVDDDFTASAERVRKFCALLDERKIEKHFIAFSRADFIAAHESEVVLMKEHGFDAFFVGLESYRSGELDRFDKRTSVEINTAAVNILEKNGLQCYSGLIVGEDWVKEDFDELIAYLNSFKHPLVNIQPITPMPGTPLYDGYANISVPREKYELWDMAHVVFRPRNMSRRAYYYHIVRAYMKTSASKKQRGFIKERYGKKIYARVKRGAAHIFFQYLSQMIKPSR